MNESSYLSIPVIIPSLEPDEKLLQLLMHLKQTGIQRILLVNDGSSSEYDPLFQQAADEFGCVVLRHAVNMGKGRALKTAFNECLNRWPDAIGCVTADSDGQHTPDCILRVMQALTQHPQALVLGVRDFDTAGIPARSQFGNKVTRTVFRVLIGLSLTDTQTGLRGISADYMRTLLHTKGERFEFESNMLIDTKEHDICIVETPIDTVYLEENKSSHFHAIRDSARVYSVFVKFLLSSLSSSVIDLALFSMFCGMLAHLVPGAAFVMVATVLARVISACYNYFINYVLVFKSKTNHRVSTARYFALALAQMTVSALLVGGLYSLFQHGELLIKICVDVCLFFISFQLQREFIYRSKRGDQTPPTV